MGLTLFRYFMLRYLVMTVQIFVGLTLLAYVIDLTEVTRQLGDLKDFTFAQGLLMSALRIPRIVQTATPFIILIAAMAALMTFNRRYELVVARSAGVSAWQFLTPLCVASFAVGVVALVAFNPLAAWSFSQAELLEAEMRGRTVAGNTTLKIPWLRQQTDEGKAIIGAVNTANRGRSLFNATIIRFDENGRIKDRLDADRAELGDGEWLLNNVTIIVGGKERESVEQMRIKSGLRPELIEERLTLPETVPFFELNRKIEAARSFGLNANAFVVQFHSLMAMPVLLIAMTLIAATVSLRFARFGQSATMILGGILVGFLLYVVSVLAKAFGSAGLVPPVVAAWAPVIVTMFYGVTFLLHKEDG